MLINFVNLFSCFFKTNRLRLSQENLIKYVNYFACRWIEIREKNILKFHYKVTYKIGNSFIFSKQKKICKNSNCDVIGWLAAANIVALWRHYFLLILTHWLVIKYDSLVHLNSLKCGVYSKLGKNVFYCLTGTPNCVNTWVVI